MRATRRPERGRLKLWRFGSVPGPCAAGSMAARARESPEGRERVARVSRGSWMLDLGVSGRASGDGYRPPRRRSASLRAGGRESGRCGSWVVTERHARHSGTQHGGGRSRAGQSPQDTHDTQEQDTGHERGTLFKVRSSSLPLPSCPCRLPACILRFPSRRPLIQILARNICISTSSTGLSLASVTAGSPPPTTPRSLGSALVLFARSAARPGPHLDMCMAWIMHQTLTSSVPERPQRPERCRPAPGHCCLDV